MGGANVFPSYPAALLIVGLEAVEVVLLALEGAAETCPLWICHYKRITDVLSRNNQSQTSVVKELGRDAADLVLKSCFCTICLIRLEEQGCINLRRFSKSVYSFILRSTWIIFLRLFV